MVCLSYLKCLFIIWMITQSTYVCSLALMHFSGGTFWHWVKLLSNLKSMPMKKQCRHFVMKVFIIFQIYEAFTSCLSLGICSSKETNSLVIFEVFLVLFDMVLCLLLVGICTPLSLGASMIEVILNSIGIAHGFLQGCILNKSTPCCFVACLYSVSQVLVLPYLTLFKEFTASFSF